MIRFCAFFVLLALPPGLPYKYRFTTTTRGVFQLKSSVSPESQTIESDKEVVYRVVSAALSVGDPSMIDPQMLTENDHILTKNTVYEDAMSELLNSCESPSSVAALEAVDSVLRSFIVSTRKARSKLKVSYLLAGASSSRVDEAVEMLASADEIDSHLLLYIEGLVQRRLHRATTSAHDSDDLPEAGTHKLCMYKHYPNKLIMTIF